METPKLTDLQRRFAEAYVAQPAGRGRPGKAAVAAGYSHRHAAVTACRLLKDARIVAAIELASKVGGKLPEPEALPATDDPLTFLKATMNSQEASLRMRLDAAKALMPFLHPRKGETGKKEEQRAAAKATAASGRFQPGPRPGLRAVSDGG